MIGKPSIQFEYYRYEMVLSLIIVVLRYAYGQSDSWSIFISYNFSTFYNGKLKSINYTQTKDLLHYLNN